jgi:type IV secretion system protein VirB9
MNTRKALLTGTMMALSLGAQAHAQTVPALDAPIATHPSAPRSQPIVLTATPAQAQRGGPPANPAATPASSSPVALAPSSSPGTVDAAPRPQYPMHAPPPIAPLSGQQKPLRAREAQAVKMTTEYAAAPVTPVRSTNGLISFVFGQTQPTLVCAPMQICRIELQQGEVINNLNAADVLGWDIMPAAVGEEGNQTISILVKPKEVGLSGNLIIATNRRLYDVQLASRKTDRMMGINFTYPEDQAAQWKAFNENMQRQAAAAAARKDQERRATVLPTGQTITDLDFNFEMTGDRPSWRPLRVYSDGKKTYIEFPDQVENGEAPVLVMLDGSTEQVVNYRKVKNRFIVDQVLERGALLSGVGRRQTKVIIHRTGGA